VRMSGQGVYEIIDDLNLDQMSLSGLCEQKRYFIGRLLRSATNPYSEPGGIRRGIRAVDSILVRRGYDKRYCEGGTYAYKRTPAQARQPSNAAQSAMEAPKTQASKNSPRSEYISAPIQVSKKKIRRKIGELRSDQYADMVGIGDSESQMRSKLSRPARKETQAGVTAYQYCTTGKRRDTVHTFFVLSGRVELLKNRDYRQTGAGSCLTRLRPVDWQDWDSGR